MRRECRQDGYRGAELWQQGLRTRNEPIALEAPASTRLGHHLAVRRNRRPAVWIYSFILFHDFGNVAGLRSMAIKSSVILAVAAVRLCYNGSIVLRSATFPKLELEYWTVRVKRWSARRKAALLCIDAIWVGHRALIAGMSAKIACDFLGLRSSLLEKGAR